VIFHNVERMSYAFLSCFYECTGLEEALKTEQAKNAVRISQIEIDVAPLVAEFNQITTAIDGHNAQHPDGECTYPEGHPEVCALWM
jgi:hypothetical protein